MCYEDWKEHMRQFYASHPEQAKKWLENNRERFREYQKEYYKTYNAERIECPFCKSEISKGGFSKHKKTLKCKKEQISN